MLQEVCRVQIKCDGTRWRTGGEVKGKWAASTLHTTSEHGVSSITTDAHISAASSRLNWRPADLNGLVRFGGRRNLVSTRVPSHFKCSLHTPDSRSSRPIYFARWRMMLVSPQRGMAPYYFSGALNFQVITRFRGGGIFRPPTPPHPSFFYSQSSSTFNTWAVNLGGKVRTIFLAVIFSQSGDRLKDQMRHFESEHTGKEMFYTKLKVFMDVKIHIVKSDRSAPTLRINALSPDILLTNWLS